MDRIRKKPKHIPWKTILLLFLTIVFLSFSIILTYDSVHYLGYVSIFEGNSPASSWDIVRGPVFPVIIHLSDILFGKTSTGVLICSLIFYLSFSIICYIICKDISKKYKHHRIINATILAYIILNPLIFGYFHVLLTEYIAITVTMLNILFSYKWIFINPGNKKKSIPYLFFFTLTTILCWHLKQPYIVIAIIPLITAVVISIIKNHKRSNVIYRLITLFSSIIFLIISIIAWNAVLDKMQVNKNSNRDSSSILNTQIITTYELPDSNNSGISSLIAEFGQNPLKIIGIYARNYCSIASICKVSSEDGVNYISTSETDLTETYENTAIGYATYNRTENVFQISDKMKPLASNYITPVSKSVFRPFMKVLIYPTNILFKTITICCPFITIILLIYRLKTKNKKNNNLFYLSTILLITATSHLLFSSAALVIDRYAIEAFTPALLGTFGTVTYIYLTIKSKKELKNA